MRAYVKHRLSFRAWNKRETPCYWLPTIWRAAFSFHNGRRWQLYFAWLYLRARIEVVTAGILEKNEGNRKYDPSDWEEHPSIWWHIWKHLKRIKKRT